jgi:transcriptional regulator GlxA family with amidase domain
MVWRGENLTRSTHWIPAIKNAELVAEIGERARQVETLTSVGTGSMLLGQAGPLDGRHATTH